MWSWTIECYINLHLKISSFTWQFFILMAIYACKQAGYAEKMANVWEKLAEETDHL
jgi:hypothetical protein